jgi:hypothetical protein
VYLRFEAEPDEVFDYFLADRLKWRSVEEMRRRMGNDEYVRWGIWFAREKQREELRWRS